MTLFYRRIIYLIFVAIFLIVTPLVVLYTQGYRYNFKKNRVQKTGILVVSSIPSGAAIYLNEKKLVGQTTDGRIEELLPADYQIKLTKSGYHSWQKKLPIKENTTTFAEEIILWKKNFPLLVDNSRLIDWRPAPDRNRIAAIDSKNQLVFFELNPYSYPTEFDQKKILPLENFQKPKIINWSNTGKKILLQAEQNGQCRYLSYNIEQTPPKLTVLPSYNYQTVKWDRQNDNLIYGLNQAGIWKINLFQSETKLIAPGNFDDFLIADGKIYFRQGSQLAKKPLEKSDSNTEYFQTSCSGCQFLTKKSGKIILKDNQKQKIIFLDSEQKAKPIIKPAKEISWLNEKTLLFYSDWEIHSYQLEKKEPELITRLGTKIISVSWHPAGRHIIFSSQGKIKIIELDNRESRNIIQLAEFQKFSGLTIEPKGKNIYFSGRISDQPGIFKLIIQ